MGDSTPLCSTHQPVAWRLLVLVLVIVVTVLHVRCGAVAAAPVTVTIVAAMSVQAASRGAPDAARLPL